MADQESVIIQGKEPHHFFLALAPIYKELEIIANRAEFNPEDARETLQEWTAFVQEYASKQEGTLEANKTKILANKALQAYSFFRELDDKDLQEAIQEAVSLPNRLVELSTAMQTVRKEAQKNGFYVPFELEQAPLYEGQGITIERSRAVEQIAELVTQYHQTKEALVQEQGRSYRLQLQLNKDSKEFEEVEETQILEDIVFYQDSNIKVTSENAAQYLEALMNETKAMNTAFQALTKEYESLREEYESLQRTQEVTIAQVVDAQSDYKKLEERFDNSARGYNRTLSKKEKELAKLRGAATQAEEYKTQLDEQAVQITQLNQEAATANTYTTQLEEDNQAYTSLLIELAGGEFPLSQKLAQTAQGLDEGQLEQKTRLYEQAFKLNPDSLSIARNLTTCYEQLGQEEKATKVYATIEQMIRSS